MQKPSDIRWSELHRRKLAGEALTDKETSEYEVGCQEHDGAELLDGSLAHLRDLRAQIAQARTDRESIIAQEQALDARINELEARLDIRTRQLLGIAS